MRMGSASGLQVAFLVFAVLLLAVPFSNALLRAAALSAAEADLARRAIPLALLGVLLLFAAGLRRLSRESLATAVPRHKRREVVIVTAMSMAIPFAVVGGKVLWWWITEGPSGVAQHVRTWPSHDATMGRSLSTAGLATAFLVGGILAPIAEELAFRRFLYRAWERQWGWIAAMVLSSLVFGIYHQELVYPLLGGMVAVALYRRTQSLRAAIYSHAAYNVSVFYPFLGQWTFPLRLDAPGDLGNWGLHFACLGLVTVALPAYLFMARGPAHDLEPKASPDASLPR